MATYRWRHVGIRDLAQAEALATALTPLLGQASPPVTLDHDPRWLAGMIDSSRSVRVYVLEVDSKPIGYAPFFIHPTSLTYSMGEVTLFRYRIQRYALTAAPLLNTTELGPEQVQACLLALFQTCRQDLRPREVLFFRGVPADSPFFTLLARLSPLHDLFHVLPYGPLYQRRLIELSDTYEQYVGALGVKTRQDLRRTQRRFAQETKKGFFVQCFQQPEDVLPFLEAAAAISQKTYQWHLLGLGIAPSPHLIARLTMAAHRGFFRSYVLYVADQPAAFQLGYDFAGTYYAHNIGHDPEFAKLQIGIFLHIEIIKHLTATVPRPSRFDFLYGDNLHKQRLSTVAREERHFYLIPRTVEGTLVAHSLQATHWASEALGRVLARYDLKDKIKVLFRRRATPVTSQPPSEPHRE